MSQSQKYWQCFGCKWQ